MKQPNWIRILTILLVLLATYALLYVLGSVLFRFRQTLFLFVMSAILAYILTPLVNGLQTVFRTRWIAILLAYVMLATALFTLAVMLFTPFIQQSQSLVDNLHTPSSGSLKTIKTVEQQTVALYDDLHNQAALLSGNGQVSDAQVAFTQAEFRALQRSVSDLRNGTLTVRTRAKIAPLKPNETRLPPSPQPQTKLPPSYTIPIDKQVSAASKAYGKAVADRASVDRTVLAQAVSHAARARLEARRIHNVMSSTPLLLLRAQTWLDQRGLSVDLHDKFGQAASQLSDQGTYLLDNAITIVSATANILVNTALVLIITFYLLSDGGRLMRGGLHLMPERYREQVWFFILSLDKVLGNYIRGQLFLSGLAGLLGGAGAAALGVPYPLLIGIMTFLLESIPVIGPMIAMFPAIAIALFFQMPLATTVILTIYFIAFQQIVTNIIGPRINSKAVGIHPLEAILAVLVGYPIGGFLGAFLAVPVAGIIHIVVRELYGYFAHGRSLPTAVVPPAEAEESAGSVVTLAPVAPAGGSRPTVS